MKVIEDAAGGAQRINAARTNARAAVRAARCRVHRANVPRWNASVLVFAPTIKLNDHLRDLLPSGVAYFAFRDFDSASMKFEVVRSGVRFGSLQYRSDQLLKLHKKLLRVGLKLLRRKKRKVILVGV